MAARLSSAMWSNISDCDETFNYLEPVNLLWLVIIVIIRICIYFYYHYNYWYLFYYWYLMIKFMFYFFVIIIIIGFYFKYGYSLLVPITHYTTIYHLPWPIALFYLISSTTCSMDTECRRGSILPPTQSDHMPTCGSTPSLSSSGRLSTGVTRCDIWTLHLLFYWYCCYSYWCYINRKLHCCHQHNNCHHHHHWHFRSSNSSYWDVAWHCSARAVKHTFTS